MASGLYNEAGLEVIENSGDEILDLAVEMNARIDGTWLDTEEDNELQRRYLDFFPPNHPQYGFTARVGAHFLRQNRELLDG